MSAGAGLDPELSALLAMFDAAYFLGSGAEPVFTEGAAGGDLRVTVATLVHEQRPPRAARRRLAGRGVDLAPVVPVRRVRRQRVILTGVQAEILLNADGTHARAAGPRPRADGVRLPARRPRARRGVAGADRSARVRG